MEGEIILSLILINSFASFARREKSHLKGDHLDVYVTFSIVKPFPLFISTVNIIVQSSALFHRGPLNAIMPQPSWGYVNCVLSIDLSFNKLI